MQLCESYHDIEGRTVLDLGAGTVSVLHKWSGSMAVLDTAEDRRSLVPLTSMLGTAGHAQHRCGSLGSILCPSCGY